MDLPSVNIDTLVNRFLAWPLPGDVAVDPCAMALDYPGRSGTNLLNASQAKQMLEHVLAGVNMEKVAPVQGFTPGIPWSLHLEAYDAYCKECGPQPALIDLEGRHCRGGFGTRELDKFIPGWRDKVSEIGRLRARVAHLESLLA